MSGIGGRRLTKEEADRDAVVRFAGWLLQTRDIAIHDITLRLEEFAREAYSRGVEAAGHKQLGMVQGRHTEVDDDE